MFVKFSNAKVIDYSAWMRMASDLVAEGRWEQVDARTFRRDYGDGFYGSIAVEYGMTRDDDHYNWTLLRDGRVVEQGTDYTPEDAQVSCNEAYEGETGKVARRKVAVSGVGGTASFDFDGGTIEVDMVDMTVCLYDGTCFDIEDWCAYGVYETADEICWFAGYDGEEPDYPDFRQSVENALGNAHSWEREEYFAGEATASRKRAENGSDGRKCGSFTYTPNDDGKYLYVAVRACTADVPNLNFDMLPHDELKTAYKTFIGSSVFMNHDNQDPEKARGVIIDAAYHTEDEDDKWVEILMEMDEERAPKLCSLIRSGEIDTVSMGCNVESTTCSVCGNVAEYPFQFCSHIQQKGREFGGKLAYEICNGIEFFEESWVYDPADPTAYTREVAASKKAASRKLSYDYASYSPDSVWSCLEEGYEGEYTLDELKKLYDDIVDKAEYPEFDDWEWDATRSGWLRREASGKTAGSYPELNDAVDRIQMELDDPDRDYHNFGYDLYYRGDGSIEVKFLDYNEGYSIYEWEMGMTFPVDIFTEAVRKMYNDPDFYLEPYDAVVWVGVAVKDRPQEIGYEVNCDGTDYRFDDDGEMWDFIMTNEWIAEAIRDNRAWVTTLYSDGSEEVYRFDEAYSSFRTPRKTSFANESEMDSFIDENIGEFFDRVGAGEDAFTVSMSIATRAMSQIGAERRQVEDIRKGLIRSLDMPLVAGCEYALSDLEELMEAGGTAFACVKRSGIVEEFDSLQWVETRDINGHMFSSEMVGRDGEYVTFNILDEEDGDWSWTIDDGVEWGVSSSLDEAKMDIMAAYIRGYLGLRVDYDYWGNPITGAVESNDVLSPRVPDDIADDGDDGACPLCGSESFDGEICDVCGYQEPPEGFDDIDIEHEDDDEEEGEEPLDEMREEPMLDERSAKALTLSDIIRIAASERMFDISSNPDGLLRMCEEEYEGEYELIGFDTIATSNGVLQEQLQAEGAEEL